MLIYFQGHAVWVKQRLLAFGTVASCPTHTQPHPLLSLQLRRLLGRARLLRDAVVPRPEDLVAVPVCPHEDFVRLDGERP